MKTGWQVTVTKNWKTWAMFILSPLAVLIPALAFAGIPFAPFSTCDATIDQTGEVRTQCVDNFEPDVVRLTPGPPGAFDSATFDLTILDAQGIPVAGAIISAYELDHVLNISTAGDDTDTTDALGEATIDITAAGGYGNMGICADGVLICQVEVRTPDTASGNLPGKCNLPTSISFVNGADFGNSSCGFIANIGPVTPGVNSWWDLTCDNNVNVFDVNGLKGGVNGALPHFGDLGAMGTKNTCP